MLLFWVIVIAIIAVTLALILPTLLKPSIAKGADSLAERRAIFRQQFDEIAQDKANGILDGEQFEAAKSELEHRMLDEIGTSNESALVVKPELKLAAALLLIIPLASIAIYTRIGSPISATIPQVAPNTETSETANAVSAAEHNAKAGDIEPLLELLKAKLEKNPGDGTGWALLARSYVELRRHAEAIPAYEKAVQATPNDPQLLADFADALAVANGNDLTGRPEELANQALKVDPHHVKALLLSATAAFNRKDYKVAIDHWEQLRNELPTDSDVLPDVKAALNEVYALSGIKPSEINQQPLENKRPVAAAGQGVSGTVKVSAELASKLDENATLFVFAKATQGPPMPIAIVRATAKDLPYSFHLDDNNALMPGNKLSQANEVVIVARLSKTGDAKPQAGDIQGTSKAVKPNGETVNIEMNEVVK